MGEMHPYTVARWERSFLFRSFGKGILPCTDETLGGGDGGGTTGVLFVDTPARERNNIPRLSDWTDTGEVRR